MFESVFFIQTANAFVNIYSFILYNIYVYMQRSRFMFVNLKISIREKNNFKIKVRKPQKIKLSVRNLKKSFHIYVSLEFYRKSDSIK